MSLTLSSRSLLVSLTAIVLAACAQTPEAPQSVAAANPAVPPVKSCQTDYATGSHYSVHTVCLTEEEDNEVQEQTNQNMASFRALDAMHKSKGGLKVTGN